MPAWLRELTPILLLLAAITVVLSRLPKVDLGHSDAFRKRRVLNWLPLGLTYAFLYFGRYNINEATTALGKLTDNTAFGTIFGFGTAVYGASFLINGPLTDKLGGRITILISAAGVAVANLLMAGLVYAVVGGWTAPGGIVLWLTVLYCLNMYFQSFGAVSIVKVNAAWFHVRERGVQGGVFGILISLGIYFGYDWSRKISQAAPQSPYWVFLVPALVLIVALIVGFLLIRDNPSETGHPDFDVGDASSGDTGERQSVGAIFKKMLKDPVIMTIVGIEFCTGFLRNGVMSWYPKFSRAVGIGDDFVAANWGMLLCVFGILGGIFAGVISDRVFHSRRGPVVSVLYGGLMVGSLAMTALIDAPWVGWVLVFMALNYVGVHGMLSGTASADFGGKKNAGVAVGIIDGFVYAGTALQSFLVTIIIPTGEAAKVASNWRSWPIAMLPVAVVGLALCARVWNAKPKAAGAAH
jgi:MFS transporter, OPA family, glycerol-3-phosphate transporter